MASSAQLFDVALVVDATLGEAFPLVPLVLGRLPKGSRAAIVLVADHLDCPVRLAANSEQPESKVLPFELRVRGFSRDLAALKKWWSDHAESVAIDFADIALECALDAVSGLEWNDDALKRMLVITQSIPHYSDKSEMPLRTGWPCTRVPPVCWLSSLEYLERRKVRATVVLPAGIRRTGRHLGELRERVWQRLSRSGEGIIDAKDDAIQRWATRAFVAGAGE